MTRKLHATLREADWVKGLYVAPDGRGCLRWHLVRRYDPLRPALIDEPAVGAAIHALFPERIFLNAAFVCGAHGHVCVSDFNDHPATTFADVLRVLKLADR